MASLLICFAALFASAPTPRATTPVSDDFGRIWYDGRAEVNGYRWRGERYGQQRTGEAVAIFVTEPFDTQARVKIDDPSAASGAEVTAMKLNLVRDFQTGVYDYNTMTSVFVRADDFVPLKTTFSSAEWCGHVFETIDFGDRETRLDVLSYFQGESTALRLSPQPGGIVEDQLFVWLRGLRTAPLAAGESVRLPFLASSFERRLRHRPAEWGTAVVTRDASTGPIEVPAGRFVAVTYRVEAPDGRSGSFRIEANAPHRLLAWRWERGGVVTDAGELTGSQRMRYWAENGEGREALRAELGLE